MKIWVIWLGAFLFVATSLIAAPFVRHAIGKKDADRHWRERPAVTLTDIGKVNQLLVTIMAGPKVESEQGLLGEAGLSLRLDVDGTIWLYDLGLRGRNEQSALRSNAPKLGLDLADTDAVFLSHRHRDHMGGVQAEKGGRLDLTDIGTGGLRVVSPPGALHMPELSIMEIHQPLKLGEGVASLDPIRRALFIGTVDEQAMVLDVRGYGLVVVVGCGHQTVPKLAKRVEEVFSRPIKAIIGDLHFPVPEGRFRIAGIDAQRRLASGDGPFSPVNDDDVQAFARWARKSGVELFLVGHDTHDSVLEQTFIQLVEVGETVELSKTK